MDINLDDLDFEDLQKIIDEVCERFRVWGYARVGEGGCYSLCEVEDIKIEKKKPRGWEF